MTLKHQFLTLASATVLGLALGQAVAGEVAAPAAAPAPAAAAPAAPVAPPAQPDPEAMRAEMEKRFAEVMAERKARYEELRKRAAESGFELPEVPPMEHGWGGQDMAADMPEPMTREEWEAARLKRWEEMRARAAENGVELPETPPWVAAEQRRAEMMERYNHYRGIIEAMTDEQKEAIAALFGGSRMARGGCGGHPAMRPGMGPAPWEQMGPAEINPQPEPPGSVPAAPAAPAN